MCTPTASVNARIMHCGSVSPLLLSALEPLHFDDDFDLKDVSSLVLEGLAASARDAVRWRGRRQQQSVVAI